MGEDVYLSGSSNEAPAAALSSKPTFFYVPRIANGFILEPQGLQVDREFFHTIAELAMALPDR